MNPDYIILGIVFLAVVLGVAASWMAIVDARADRRHREWMRRNVDRARHTRAAVRGIRYGHAGVGLNGEADHTGAIRKHTAP